MRALPLFIVLSAGCSNSFVALDREDAGHDSGTSAPDSGPSDPDSGSSDPDSGSSDPDAGPPPRCSAIARVQVFDYELNRAMVLDASPDGFVFAHVSGAVFGDSDDPMIAHWEGTADYEYSKAVGAFRFERAYALYASGAGTPRMFWADDLGGTAHFVAWPASSPYTGVDERRTLEGETESDFFGSITSRRDRIVGALYRLDGVVPTQTDLRVAEWNAAGNAPVAVHALDVEPGFSDSRVAISPRGDVVVGFAREDGFVGRLLEFRQVESLEAIAGPTENTVGYDFLVDDDALFAATLTTGGGIALLAHGRTLVPRRQSIVVHEAGAVTRDPQIALAPDAVMVAYAAPGRGGAIVPHVVLYQRDDLTELARFEVDPRIAGGPEFEGVDRVEIAYGPPLAVGWTEPDLGETRVAVFEPCDL
jgi:hypothetical protein